MSRISFITFWAFSQLSDCMLPEVSMQKMIHSLSTGMPPTAATVSIFFGWFLSSRCISAVSVWCADTSACSSTFDATESPSLALNSPRIFDRSPASCAAFCCSMVSVCVRPWSSRLSTSVSPRRSNSCRCNARIWPFRSFSALDDDGPAHVGEHQQQDDGAEATGDALEERQREHFEFAALAEGHPAVLLGRSAGRDDV